MANLAIQSEAAIPAASPDDSGPQLLPSPAVPPVTHGVPVGLDADGVAQELGFSGQSGVHHLIATGALTPKRYRWGKRYVLRFDPLQVRELAASRGMGMTTEPVAVSVFAAFEEGLDPISVVVQKRIDARVVDVLWNLYKNLLADPVIARMRKTQEEERRWQSMRANQDRYRAKNGHPPITDEEFDAWRFDEVFPTPPPKKGKGETP